MISTGVIFLLGLFVTGLCALFVAVTYRGLERLGRQEAPPAMPAERRVSRPAAVRLDPAE